MDASTNESPEKEGRKEGRNWTDGKNAHSTRCSVAELSDIYGKSTRTGFITDNYP